MRIGIIGVGMVGGAIKKAFQIYNPLCRDPSKGFMENVYDTDLVFVSVPTPTDRNRNQNASALIDVLRDLEDSGYNGVVVIKCTVLPMTTDILSRSFPSLKLCHNPEFLTANKAYEDFINQKVAIVGHSYTDTGKKAESIINVTTKVYKLINVKTEYFTSRETEMAKYMHNVFLATKVIVMNEFHDVCHKEGIDYYQSLRAAVMQGKIGESHTTIAPDGKLGYSGFCFPKDVTAFLKKFNHCNIETLKKQWVVNKKLRGTDDFISTFW